MWQIVGGMGQVMWWDECNSLGVEMDLRGNHGYEVGDLNLMLKM